MLQLRLHPLGALTPDRRHHVCTLLHNCFIYSTMHTTVCVQTFECHWIINAFCLNIVVYLLLFLYTNITDFIPQGSNWKYVSAGSDQFWHRTIPHVDQGLPSLLTHICVTRPRWVRHLAEWPCLCQFKSFNITSLALATPNDCPSTSKATQGDKGVYTITAWYILV